MADTFSLTTEGGEALLPQVFGDMPLGELWDRREDLWHEIQDLQRQKGRIEMELLRRFREAHPAFDGAEGGTVDLAEDGTVLKLSYTRDFNYSPEGVANIARLVADAPDLLSAAEFDALVAFDPKVSGRKFNELLRRGGRLAEVLLSARTLVSAAPRFDLKKKVRD
ncbi:MAG: hypothetical protein ACREXY_17720 [Gammaproteobacteria bacterium]